MLANLSLPSLAWGFSSVAKIAVRADEGSLNSAYYTCVIIFVIMVIILLHHTITISDKGSTITIRRVIVVIVGSRCCCNTTTIKSSLSRTVSNVSFCFLVQQGLIQPLRIQSTAPIIGRDQKNVGVEEQRAVT